MKKYFQDFFILIFTMLICSCAAISSPPKYEYEKEAVRISLKSDPRLNLYQGSPHTLVVCTYQLKDPNAFNQLVDEKDGLSKLLECSHFDPSVTYSRMLVIQPGQELKESLDRAEGAKYLGIVAGYFTLEKEHVVRLFQIPVSGLSKKAVSLDIDLYLGPHEVQDIKVK